VGEAPDDDDALAALATARARLRDLLGDAPTSE
jgi:hypothetical protein